MSDYKIELSVCEDEIEKLTDWEQKFITSLHDQFSRTGTLSSRQQEILHQIYEKVA